MVDRHVAVLLDSAEQHRHRDLVATSALLDQAEALIGPHDLPVHRARLGMLRGEIALDTSRLPEAIAAFQVARMDWLSGGRSLEARDAMLGRTAAVLAVGEYAVVVQLVERILNGIEELSSDDEELATRLHIRAHQQLGAAHSRLDDAAASGRHFDLADDLARRIGDRRAVGQIAVWRARKLTSGGMVHRAIAVLDDARRDFLAEGALLPASRAAIAMAEAWVAAGLPVLAMRLLDHIGPDLDLQRVGLAERDRVYADALLAAGRTEEALSRGLAARDAFRQAGRISDCAKADLVCAGAAVRLGRFELASRSLGAAERLSEECGELEPRDEARLQQAKLARRTGDQAAAHAGAQRILADPTTLPSTRVRATLLVASTAETQTESEAAIAAASADVDRIAGPELRMELRLVRARTLRRSGRLREAAAELRAVAGMEPLVAHQVRTGQVHGGLLAEVSDELIDVLVADGSHSAVIEAWQRMRAAKVSAFSTLRGHTHGWQADDGAGHEPDIDDLVADAYRRIADTVANAADPVPDVSSGSSIEYYVIADDVLAFVVRDGQIFVRRLARAAAATARLADAWQHECTMIAALKEAEASSSRLDGLYDALILPLVDLIVDIGIEPLAVAAHRHLLSVPFDAMLDVGAPWRERFAPFVDQVGVDAAPGVAATSPKVLVLALPDEKAPAIASEADLIAATLPGSAVFRDDSATSLVLAEGMGNANVVHIATHGRFHAGNPLFSALRLADGWLTAADLLDGRFPLQGRVVVLSACGSGRAADTLIRPIGLAWACLQAGAEGVVAALWAVDDAVTVELMGAFYRHLAAGDLPRAALSKARRQVASSYPHPYYWAAFRYFTATS